MNTKENMFDHFVIVQNKHILISYKGPVTPVIMAEISRDIRDKLGDNPRASRKVFSVFMELAQNILFYSAEKIQYAGRFDSVGMLQITEMPDHFVFSCGNTIKKEHVIMLVDSCKTINSLNKDELRQLKRYQRQQPQGEVSQGAGIGLVQVAILSGNPLEIQAHDLDENHSFFTLSVNINK